MCKRSLLANARSGEEGVPGHVGDGGLPPAVLGKPGEDVDLGREAIVAYSLGGETVVVSDDRGDG